MDELDKSISIEKFISEFEYNYHNLKLLLDFLAIEDPKQKKQLKLAMKMIRDKVKSLDADASEEELKKQLKIKKIYKEYGDKV